MFHGAASARRACILMLTTPQGCLVRLTVHAVVRGASCRASNEVGGALDGRIWGITLAGGLLYLLFKHVLEEHLYGKFEWAWERPGWHCLEAAAMAVPTWFSRAVAAQPVGLQLASSHSLHLCPPPLPRLCGPGLLPARRARCGAGVLGAAAAPGRLPAAPGAGRHAGRVKHALLGACDG